MKATDNISKGWVTTAIGLCLLVPQFLHFMGWYHVPGIEQFDKTTNWIIFGIGFVCLVVPRTTIEGWITSAYATAIDIAKKKFGSDKTPPTA